MTRVARQLAETGLYHVTVRGNGRQMLFYRDKDRLRFLEVAERVLTRGDVAVLAWCLMDNHAHLLLEDAGLAMSGAMHALLTAYARYFNNATGHVGHVFQERYSSEPIKDDRQLLAVVRYIHQNPERAGVCSSSEYRWSSYHAYATGMSDVLRVQTNRVLSLLGDAHGFVELVATLPEVGEARYHERPRCHATPEELRRIAVEALGGEVDPQDIKAMPAARRDRAIRALRRAGFSIRQIERLTGIGRNVIAKVRCNGSAGETADN